MHDIKENNQEITNMNTEDISGLDILAIATEQVDDITCNLKK